MRCLRLSPARRRGVVSISRNVKIVRFVLLKKPATRISPGIHLVTHSRSKVSKVGQEAVVKLHQTVRTENN